MIVFLTTGSHQYTHKDVAEAASGRIEVRVMTYDRLFEKNLLKTLPIYLQISTACPDPIFLVPLLHITS